MSGDTEAARHWLSEHEPALHEPVSLYGILSAFTTCRAYITCNDYNSAIMLLTKILELAGACNQQTAAIEANILLSIAYWKKKRNFQKGALGYLEEAVSQAYPYRYTQIFINETAELSGMMQRLQRRLEQQRGKDAALAGFVKMLYLKMPRKNTGLTTRQAALGLRFTEKQKTVMALLCEGKSYREITQAQGIALSTLRSHIALIYKKMDATNQKDATLKIRAMNLLE